MLAKHVATKLRGPQATITIGNPKGQALPEEILDLKLDEDFPLKIMGKSEVSEVSERSLARGRVILGKFGTYEERGIQMGARTFRVNDGYWKSLTPDQRWALNKNFLDDAISRGDEILLSNPIPETNSNSFFRKEIDYLMQREYPFRLMH